MRFRSAIRTFEHIHASCIAHDLSRGIQITQCVFCCRRMAEIMVQELGRRASDDAGANANSGVTGRYFVTAHASVCIAAMSHVHEQHHSMHTCEDSLRLQIREAMMCQSVSGHDVAGPPAAYRSARIGRGTPWRWARRWASSCWAQGTRRPGCRTCGWTTACGEPVASTGSVCMVVTCTMYCIAGATGLDQCNRQGQRQSTDVLHIGVYQRSVPINAGTTCWVVCSHRSGARPMARRQPPPACCSVLRP